MKIKEGQKAPDFSLSDASGVLHSLEENKGNFVLLYFYPKDDTPGCTKEACAIRDDYGGFKKIKAKVFGISADSIKSHQKFRDKYNLPFPILSDEDKVVVKKYGVWGKKKFMGREYMGIERKSFLIDPNGNVIKIYEKVSPEEHAKEVLNDLNDFKKNKIK